MVEKMAHVEPLVDKAGLRIGLVDPGSVNMTWADADGLPAAERPRVREHGRGDPLGVRGVRSSPSRAEHLDLRAHVAQPHLAFHRAGKLPPGAMIKLYFGGPYGYFARGEGVSFGLPPTVKAVDAYVEVLEGSNLPWSVSALGGDILATPAARHALELGGTSRSGWRTKPARACCRTRSWWPRQPRSPPRSGVRSPRAPKPPRSSACPAPDPGRLPIRR